MLAALSLAFFLAPSVPAGEFPPADKINDLADAPAAWERFRFPDSAYCEWALKFNARFADNVSRERACWPERYQTIFDATLDETAELRKPWNALAWAQWGTRAEWQRRLDLRALRDWLGPEAWEAGEMPPITPVWRYRDLR